MLIQIIEHGTIPIDEDEIPETLYCKSEKLAIHRLADLLCSYDDDVNEIPRQRQIGKYRLCRTRKVLVQYIGHLVSRHL